MVSVASCCFSAVLAAFVFCGVIVASLGSNGIISFSILRFNSREVKFFSRADGLYGSRETRKQELSTAFYNIDSVVILGNRVPITVTSNSNRVITDSAGGKLQGVTNRVAASKPPTISKVAWKTSAPLSAPAPAPGPTWEILGPVLPVYEMLPCKHFSNESVHQIAVVGKGAFLYIFACTSVACCIRPAISKTSFVR